MASTIPQGDQSKPCVEVIYTSWACCDTLTKTMNVKGVPKSFSEQPHLDLDFTVSDSEKHFTGEMHYHLIARERNNRKRYYIAFKGTENLNDAVTDIKIYQSFSLEDGPGAVHAGFTSRANEIPVRAIVDLLNAENNVVVTGYSLGGAVALLVLFRILKHDRAQPVLWVKKGLLQCITFGSPYVGEQVFLETYLPYKDIIHNFVNSDDIVPRLLSMGSPLGILVPDYKPIGRFHTVLFGESPKVIWDGATPVFKPLGNHLNSVKYHVCYYHGLLQALGGPTENMASGNQVSTVLQDVCPQISRFEWDTSSSTLSVYGKHLHEKITIFIDGVPNCKVEVVPPVLPHVMKYKIGITGTLEGKSFRIQSHIPFHGNGAYVLTHQMPRAQYLPAPERSRMLTLSKLLVGQIAIQALRSFTSASAFQNKDLSEIVDHRVATEVKGKALDILSVVAVHRLHQMDMSFIEKLFEENQTDAVLGIIDPTFLQRQARRVAPDLIGTLDIVRLIEGLNGCYPESLKYADGSQTPRPEAFCNVMKSLAELGKRYNELVFTGNGGTTNLVDVQMITELDGLEKSVQYHLQCLQCTWLAFSLRLYWEQLEFSLRRDQKSRFKRAISWITGGILGNSTSLIDHKYEKRVGEMAKALNVETEGRKFWEYEYIISTVKMPSPDTGGWSTFIENREMLQFANRDSLEKQRRVHKTWKLIKFVAETRKSADQRFIVAVMGPTKAGKGTLLHKALEAKSQFGSNLNTICPRLYDVSHTAMKWKEMLNLNNGRRTPLVEAIDMPSIDDVTAREGNNQFQLTHQLCPFLDAVVILLKAPGLNDAGVNRILEMVKMNSRCKVLLTIGHLERFWDDVTVMDTPKEFDPDDPDEDGDTGVSGQAEKAATTILALLEKLDVDTWNDRMQIVLTDVRYKSRKLCDPSAMAKYDELVERLEARGIKFFFTIEIRQWIQARYCDYCVEWGIAKGSA